MTITIKELKARARSASKTSGTSYQSELNRIASAHGHANWGSLQRALTSSAHSTSNNTELALLIRAFQTARMRNHHLVVLRQTPEEEEDAISLLWEASETSDALDGAAFTPFLTNVGIETAEAHGQTLIAGSGDMPRLIDHGNLIVTHADYVLTFEATNIPNSDREAVLKRMVPLIPPHQA